MPADIESILKLEVPVIVQIAVRQMPVKEVMNLVPGAIIELPKLADEELEILVNNKPIGTGSAVKVGENFGIRVAYLGDLAARIQAMGPGGNGGNAEDGDGEAAGAGATVDDAAASALAEQLLAGQ